MPTLDENLITAAKEGDSEKVIELLNSGADLEATNNDGWTALICAAANGHAAVVTVLLEKGADPKARNNNGRTALHLAATKGHAVVVNVLVQAGADPEASNRYARTALIIAATNGHAAVVTALLEKEADLEGKIDMLATALHLAAHSGHPAVVTALLEKGADPKATNRYACTALHFAAQNGHLEVVTALLEKGADPKATNNNGNTALHFAAQNGHLEVVIALVQAEADLEASNRYRNTALYLAAEKGHAAVVTVLLDRGANPNGSDQYWDTALIRAAKNGHAAVVAALLNAGADPNAKDSARGNTAWIWAASRGHIGIASETKKYIKSGEFAWRQHLPRLRQAAREYNHPTTQSSVRGLSPESELAETASIESNADTLIRPFLRSISISQPQKRLAFSKLLNYRLSEASPVKDFCMDVFPIVATMLAAKPKRIDPEIMENFAKIMAALSVLEKYKGNRPDVAREIIVKIIKLTERGEIFSSKGDFVGIDEVIQTLSGDNYAEVFKTTNLWGLTKLQKVISDVSEILGGKSYPDPVSFVELKKELDPKRKSSAVVAQTDSSSSNFFQSAAEPEAQAAEAQAAEPEPKFRAAP